MFFHCHVFHFAALKLGSLSRVIQGFPFFCFPKVRNIGLANASFILGRPVMFPPLIKNYPTFRNGKGVLPPKVKLSPREEGPTQPGVLNSSATFPLKRKGCPRWREKCTLSRRQKRFFFDPKNALLIPKKADFSVQKRSEATRCPSCW